MNQDCQLCDAIHDAEAPENSALENSPIAESPHFLVLPSVGPLVTGQAIVVSREHYPSLASMGRSAIAEYDQLVHEIIPDRTGWLEAEHGARGCPVYC